MLLGREISIPPRKTLKALCLDRFASTLCLPPGAHRFKVIPASRPAESADTPLVRDAKANPVSIRERIRKCIGKEV